jgi:hypothetical protein
MTKELAALAALLALAAPAAAQRIAVNPSTPAYGQGVTIGILETPGPIFLPGTRYTRLGTNIIVDYEYVGNAQAYSEGFGPNPPAQGAAQISLGELPAGFYNIQARLIDVSRPGSGASVVSTSVAVMAPQEWGIYPVPYAPNGNSPAYATLRSAVYFDPASMRASVQGNVVRVDFTFKDDAPAITPTPPGMVTTASIEMPALRPGAYVLEGWGRKLSGGDYERYFTKSFTVSPNVEVVEYYSAALDHYFISAGPEEIALLDRNGNGDWKRTGQSMLAWARQADAPPGAVPVCRFYAAGPNSHFYTASQQECETLRALERDQRAQASARGQPFLGWAFETNAFWAVLPENGRCPGTMRPVYRAYNNRAHQMDSNHRFMTDGSQRDAMSAGWVDEGVAFCSA